MKTLREAIYETIHRDPAKKLADIAEVIGMSESYLTRAGLPDQEESETGSGCRFPLKKLLPLIQYTGNFAILDYIEQSLGRVAIPLPRGNGDKKEIVRLAMASVSEFGQLMTRLDEGIEDGKLTADEVSSIEKEGYEAIQAITSLLQNLKAMK
jgi:hypothetical protein